jgi:predicted transcriptional regulator
MMPINAKKLMLAQARAGLSSDDLRKKAKISGGTLSRIRSGTQEPRPQTVGRLADKAVCYSRNPDDN